MLCQVALSLALMQAVPGGPAVPTVSLPPPCLVEAEPEPGMPHGLLVRTSPPPGVVVFSSPTPTVALRITRVYVGPEELNGRTFRYAAAWSHPPLSLWWVDLVPKEQPRPPTRPEGLDAYQVEASPYQRSRWWLTREFSADIPALDTAIRRVKRARAGSQRFALLQELAATEPFPVADWALFVLAQDGKVDPLKELAGKPQLPANRQVTLDVLLCRFDPDGWTSSPAREKMLSGWLEPGAGELYFELGCKRLGEATWAGEIDFALYARLLDPLLARGDRLSENQVGCLGEVLRSPRFAKEDRAKAFDWLLGWVRNAKTAGRGRLDLEAARGLSGLPPFTRDQVEALRALRDAAGNDQGMADALTTLLRDADGSAPLPGPRKVAAAVELPPVKVEFHGRPGDLSLLGDGAVQADLRLSAEQRKKIQALIDDVVEQQRDVLRAKGEERYRRRVDALRFRREYEKTALTLLEPGQARRLNQIVLQYRTTAALTDPEVRQELKITGEQMKQMDAVEQEFVAWNLQADEQYQKDQDGAGRLNRYRANWSRRERRRTEVLTPAQQAQWQEMLGEPCKGSPWQGGLLWEKPRSP
jgi:hypothetical protein